MDRWRTPTAAGLGAYFARICWELGMSNLQPALTGRNERDLPHIRRMMPKAANLLVAFSRGLDGSAVEPQKPSVLPIEWRGRGQGAPSGYVLSSLTVPPSRRNVRL
jgi:hypothetical protein